MKHRALDGELAAEERAFFEKHLAACPSCRRAYETLARAVAAFAAAPFAAPPLAFAAAVRARAERARARAVRRGRFFSWVTAGTTGLIVTAAVGAWAAFLRPVLGAAAGLALARLVTTLAEGWRVAEAVVVSAAAFGKIASALASVGAELAWAGIRAAAPAYFGAFAVMAFFYIIWRLGSRAAPLPVRAM